MAQLQVVKGTGEDSAKIIRINSDGTMTAPEGFIPTVTVNGILDKNKINISANATLDYVEMGWLMLRDVSIIINGLPTDLNDSNTTITISSNTTSNSNWYFGGSNEIRWDSFSASTGIDIIINIHYEDTYNMSINTINMIINGQEYLIPINNGSNSSKHLIIDAAVKIHPNTGDLQEAFSIESWISSISEKNDSSGGSSGDNTNTYAAVSYTIAQSIHPESAQSNTILVTKECQSSANNIFRYYFDHNFSTPAVSSSPQASDLTLSIPNTQPILDWSTSENFTVTSNNFSPNVSFNNNNTILSWSAIGINPHVGGFITLIDRDT